MHALIDDNIHCIRQGMEILERLERGDFITPCATCFGSTIGGHLRHSIDHYLSFLAGLESGAIDYDARERDPELESDPVVARRILAELALSLGRIPASALECPLRVKMDAGESDEWSDSSVRRELQFLLSHTVHHFALIVAIASQFGFRDFPEDFGMAPSTVKHRRVR